MPDIVTGQRTSYQDSGSLKQNIAPRLDFLEPMDTPFLNYIGFMSSAEGGATAGGNSLSFACTQTQHTWMNDELIPSVSEVRSAYTSGGAAIAIPDGETERFDVGDIVMIGESYWLVTGTDHPNNEIDVTTISGDANHAAGEKVYIIGNAQTEGTAASTLTGRTTDFGSNTNFTQIFMGKIDMNGTEQSVERHGLDMDPYEYQVDKKLKELAIQLERAAIYGIRNSSYPASNATRRRMGGLAYFVRDDATAQANGLSVDAGGDDLDEEYLDDVLQALWDQGATPDTIWVPMRQKRKINHFITPHVRVGRDESIAGVLVGQYQSDNGMLNVVVNRYLKPDDVIITTSEYLGMGPLAGNGNSRAFFVERLPKDGDYDRSQIIGEYTMEVRNNSKAHAWIKGLSTA